MPHLHDKIDFTVSVFIVFRNKVLLRKHEKYNRWLAVGGHIELDEDPNQAALREVKEEVGLDVVLYDSTYPNANNVDADFDSSNGYQELIPPVFLNRHKVKPGHEHVDLAYFAQANSDQVVEGVGEKSLGWKWFTAKELVDSKYGVDKNIIFYAQAALEKLRV